MRASVIRRLPIAVIALTALLPIRPADANVLISIDKSSQRMTVSVDGATRWVWPVSTGLRGYATPSGTFQPFRMEEDHYSKEWDDAPMPHSIFFTKRGHAIHGSYDTRRLGSAASHGCVRLSPANATRLFALVKEQGVTNATVVISGGEPRGSMPVAKQRPAQQHAVRHAPSRDDGLDYAGSRAARSSYPVYRQPGYPQGYGFGYGYYNDRY